MRLCEPTREMIPELRQLWKAGFGDSDAFLDSFFSLAFAPERCRCVMDGDTLVTAMHWVDQHCDGARMAYLYAMSTDPAQRGRGGCRLLMTHTLHHLRSRGYTCAMLVAATPALLDTYGRMGFDRVLRVHRWEAEAAGAPATLTPLTPGEYFRRRRSFLPRHAPEPVASAWDFTKTQYAFYAGEGFLAAVQQEGSRLYAPEFLGDPGAAPGVLAALGQSRGTFQAPGTDFLFGLYAMLTEAPEPEFFALAYE